MEDGLLASNNLKKIRTIRGILQDQGINNEATMKEITIKVLGRVDQGEQLEKAVFDEVLK